MYDITERKSFDSIDKWVTQAIEVRGNDILIALIGNKLDLEEKRSVSKEELDRKCKELGIAVYRETSAKTGEGINELFDEIAVTPVP